MAEASASVWEAVRRALGRLTGAVRVRDLPPERLAATARVSPRQVLAGPACLAGAAERRWRPLTRVSAGPALPVVPGAGGVDLVAITTIIGMDAALRPAARAIFESPPLPTTCTIHRLGIGDAREASVAVPQAVALPTVGKIGGLKTSILAPNAKRLPLDTPTLPRPERAHRFGHRPASADVWRVPDARVRASMDKIADVPMTRTRLAGPLESYVAERRRLAQTSGAAFDDIMLMGVFPQVPVSAVRRLALTEGGSGLLLWLKPEALAQAAAGKPPRSATLVIGRRQSTGKMLQTVL